MVPRIVHLLQQCISVSHNASSFTFRWIPVGIQATDALGQRYFSSVAEIQDASEYRTMWHELPPVTKTWTSSDLSKAKIASNGKSSNGESGSQKITALRWVTKCCPSLPHSLRQKLFRLRQVRKQISLGNVSESERQEHSSDSLDIRPLVTGKAVVEEGTILYVPRSVVQELYHQPKARPQPQCSKTEHEPTREETAWLQSLVLYKDSEILVINKPPGLPVQGGSEIKRSLDSLMGKALSFDFDEGPRLVHRLDRDTSGSMVLARTQKSAALLHTLFRNKTATATTTDNRKTLIERVYFALVIGTPKQAQGRISVPLIKVVLDDGKAERIVVAHDTSSENSQLAITDYKVVGPSYHGCSWLELHPLTGRKHQLRVHCAEVLATPVVGDMKYGWRTQKEWLKRHLKLQESEGPISKEGIEPSIKTIDSEVPIQMQSVKGSILSNEPLLHLHCCKMTIPNVVEMLEMDMGTVNTTDGDINQLNFVAALPQHMAASRNLWAHYIQLQKDAL